MKKYLKYSLYFIAVVTFCAAFEYITFTNDENYQSLTSLQKEIEATQEKIKSDQEIQNIKYAPRPEDDVLSRNLDSATIDDFQESIPDHRERLNNFYARVAEMKIKSDSLNRKFSEILPQIKTVTADFSKAINTNLDVYVRTIDDQIKSNEKTLVTFKGYLDPELELEQEGLRKQIRYLTQSNELLKEEKIKIPEAMADLAQCAFKNEALRLLIIKEIRRLRDNSILLKTLDRSFNVFSN